jgi:hypothetical protein
MAQAGVTNKLNGQPQPQQRVKIANSLLMVVLGIVIGRFSNPPITTTIGSSTSQRSTINTGVNDSIQSLADRPSFAKLVEASGSDKYYLHHYEHYYSKWLAPYRAHPKLKIVEIGARNGKSLTLWSDYFESPHLILGVAYDFAGNTQGVQAVANAHKAVRLLFGDQSKPSTMKQVCDNGPFNIIVDDGSHLPSHQVFSLYSLWSCLEPGGLYIVEDTETNYWDDGDTIYGYRLNHTGIGASPKYSAVEKLKQFIDVLHKEKFNYTSLSIMPGDEDLCEMSFAKNTIALHKCTLEQKQNPTKAAVYAKHFDVARIKAWMKNARESNPKEFP